MADGVLLGSVQKGGDLTPWVEAVVKSAVYDIARKEKGSKLLCWLQEATELESAKSRIQELASVWPGEFDVMDGHHQTVAQVIGPADDSHKTP